jgi:hypothetical protein
MPNAGERASANRSPENGYNLLILSEPVLAIFTVVVSRRIILNSLWSRLGFGVTTASILQQRYFRTTTP